MSAVPEEVRWHDLECGGYDVDLALWRELAAQAGGPVLDLGAGTGRVALDLAAQGFAVTAVDVEPALLAALAARAADAGLAAVRTAQADLRTLALGERFALALIPMQTVQLLGGAEGRAAALVRVREHLMPGGLVAAALADALEGYDEHSVMPPLPDMAEHDGTVFSSRPVAVRDVGPGFEILRIRERVDPAGARAATEDRVVLDHLEAAVLERELAGAGFAVLPRRAVPATDEYVGSAVVVARA